MSDYECYCEPAESDGYCQVWNVSWRVARKQHTCCECKEAILPRERYQYISFVFDGSAGSYKTCAFCANEYELLRNKHRDIAWLPGELACTLVWDMRGETS